MYTAWEPPKGGEPRDGKKIIVEKKEPDTVVHKELDWCSILFKFKIYLITIFIEINFF